MQGSKARPSTMPSPNSVSKFKWWKEQIGLYAAPDRETQRRTVSRKFVTAYTHTWKQSPEDKRQTLQPKEVHGKINCLGKASTIRQRRHGPRKKVTDNQANLIQHNPCTGMQEKLGMRMKRAGSHNERGGDRFYLGALH